MKNQLGIFLIAVSLWGCASNPDKISAAYVSPLKYKDYDCDQVALEMDNVSHRTGGLYHQLKRERNADNWQTTAGVLLFWPALFFLEGGDGPEAAEYAQLKGEFNALHDVSVQKKCTVTAKSPEQIVKEAEDAAKREAEEAQQSPIQ